MRKYRIYAIYKGDNFIFEGTAKECANYLGVKEKTIHFYNTPSNKKRNKKSRTIAIIIE